MSPQPQPVPRRASNTQVSRSLRPTLAPKVWARFTHSHWQLSPVVLKRVQNAPLVNAEDMFRTLARVGDLVRRGHAGVRITLWVDGREIADAGHHLPRESDGSLEGYDERVKRDWNGSDYTLLIAEPHLYDPRVWAAARVFVRGLFEQVGVPCGGVDSTFFLGSYRRTPFGVHRGQMSVMTFPVHG